MSSRNTGRKGPVSAHRVRCSAPARGRQWARYRHPSLSVGYFLLEGPLSSQSLALVRARSKPSAADSADVHHGRQLRTPTVHQTMTTGRSVPHCRRRPGSHAARRTNGRIGEAASQRHSSREIVVLEPRYHGLCPLFAHCVGFGTKNISRQRAQTDHLLRRYQRSGLNWRTASAARQHGQMSIRSAMLRASSSSTPR